MTNPTYPRAQVELYRGPLDGAMFAVPLEANGAPPSMHAFPCPGGRGDMLYRLAAPRPEPDGRFIYEWTGQAAGGQAAT